MRMALLEGLEHYSDKLTTKEVVEKVWPYLITGFGDLVPVIREATVKSILLIAPKVKSFFVKNKTPPTFSPLSLVLLKG